ncbi:ABC transporter substrate-binding protein [Catenovulum maritimum]|uniref:Solute-binding protein family 5 domain-containing protein n=1 Tax=Catenovulum maritimum TaxID=1513271 RepID=A0A0J8JLG2_9ALTE|nr:ABC transporter substrate-binding protein [Catenovulum maritimum]KMT65401.1 hypothetical protein XM47_08535 [Catenovulum maritimum]
MIDIKLLNLFIMVLTCFITLGCEQKSNDTLKSGLIYCSEGSPENFNPQTTTSSITIDASGRQIYDRLLELNPITHEIVPSLAKNWTSNPEGTVYNFFLRDDVSFHNTQYFTPNRNLNSDDIIFSFNRWRVKSHPFHDVADSYPYMQTQQLNLLIEDIIRISDHQIQIRLVQPSNSFIEQLATDYMVILSAEYGAQLSLKEEKQLIDTQPVGTGPFKFQEYIKDQYIRFKVHENYWGDKPKLSQLVYDITPQSSTRLAKLLSAECDVISYPTASEMLILQDKDGINVQSKTPENTSYWAFNTLKPPFDQKIVRQALALAIDKQQIYKTIYYGTAFPADSLLPPSSWAYNNKLTQYEYDPVKAKELLIQAGIKSGFEMEIWAPNIERAYNPNAIKMAEVIKANLALVGISVTIIDFEWTALRKKLSMNEHDSVLFGWNADMSDPDNYLRPVLSCSAAIIGINRAAWCEPKFDELLVNAELSDSLEKRKAYLIQAQEVLNTELPLFPIAHSLSFIAKQDNIHNVRFEAFSAISFKYAEKN